MLTVVHLAVLAALLVLPCTVRAEQLAPPAAAAVPCPHANQEGGCCGGACAAMQPRVFDGDPQPAAPAEAGGCPCQRARAAKAAAEAKGAKQAQP